MADRKFVWSVVVPFCSMVVAGYTVQQIKDLTPVQIRDALVSPSVAIYVPVLPYILVLKNAKLERGQGRILPLRPDTTPVYSAAALGPYPSSALSFSNRSAAALGMLVPGPNTALAPAANRAS